MRLVRARVTNFKSIDDSGWVTLDAVTCLVGKNESGKTAFLQALQKINPAEGASASEFDLLDYPRKSLARYKKVHSHQPSDVIQAEFELSLEDQQEIEQAFGQGVLTSRLVTVTKNYQNSQTW